MSNLQFVSICIASINADVRFRCQLAQIGVGPAVRRARARVGSMPRWNMANAGAPEPSASANTSASQPSASANTSAAQPSASSFNQTAAEVMQQIRDLGRVPRHARLVKGDGAAEVVERSLLETSENEERWPVHGQARGRTR